MIRELAKSIREYKRLSIVTPILVSLEVAMECIIPFVIAILINKIKNGCDIGEVILCGAALGACSVLSLFFGAAAGAACATASCGLARNLRKDMFYSIQRYSFENIDKFMASSLVTRMTTDVTNVQNAYMMLIRMAIRHIRLCDGLRDGRADGVDIPFCCSPSCLWTGACHPQNNAALQKSL